MADGYQVRTTISARGIVTVRQRPTLLLMKVSLKAAEATLELGLARLKKQCESAADWLKRLNAVSVEFGEPYFADQDATDPLKQMGATAAKVLSRRPGRAPAAEPGRKVIVILTALWDIAALSAEELLVFVDRLHYEAAGDEKAAAEEAAPVAEEHEVTEENAAWLMSQEMIRQSMAQLAAQHGEGRDPQFLFIARLGEEEVDKATEEALDQARRNAERQARALAMPLGQVGMVMMSFGGPEYDRADQIMQRQRCGALLTGCTYTPSENEIVSDDPRSAEFRVKVDVNYYME